MFGDNDFWMSDNCEKEEKKAYAMHFGKTYDTTNLNCSQDELKNYLGGAPHFKVTEVEVY